MRTLFTAAIFLSVVPLLVHGQCCENCSTGPCNGTMCGDVCIPSGTLCPNGTPEECAGTTPYCPTSPIVLDPFGEGFHLTSLSGGVRFRVSSNKLPAKMSWTDSNWRNGWLALDRNENGRIDDFSELFGDMTVQPPSKDRNG